MPVTPQAFSVTMKDLPFAEVREPLMQAVTLILLREAQKQTPVRTGLLRRSETTHVEPGGLRGAVGTNVIYAPFAHRRVPFFQLAIESGRSDVDAAMQKAGDDYMAKLAKTTT